MSKKIISVFFGLSLMGTFSSSAMYNSAFRAIQLVTGGALIGKGFYDFDRYNKILKNPVKGEPMPSVVQSFLREKMRKLNVPESDTVPLLVRDDANNWFVGNDSAIVAAHQQIADLEESLNGKLLVVEKFNELVNVRNSYKINNAFIEDFAQKSFDTKEYTESDFKKLDDIFSELQKADDQCDCYIARQLTMFKHELKHFKGQHGKIVGLAIGIMPIVVQAGCSGLTYATNKLLSRKSPATLMSFCIRSGMSMLGIESKGFFSDLGLIVHKHYREKESDQFACENAETRLELQEGYNWHLEGLLSFKEEHCNNVSLSSGIKQDLLFRWRHLQFDPVHPYRGDRAAMYKQYLDAWGAEHKKQ